MKRLTVWVGAGIAALGISMATLPVGIAAANTDSASAAGATPADSAGRPAGKAERGARKAPASAPRAGRPGKGERASGVPAKSGDSRAAKAPGRRHGRPDAADADASRSSGDSPGNDVSDVASRGAPGRWTPRIGSTGAAAYRSAADIAVSRGRVRPGAPMGKRKPGSAGPETPDGSARENPADERQPADGPNATDAKAVAASVGDAPETPSATDAPQARGAGTISGAARSASPLSGSPRPERRLVIVKPAAAVPDAAVTPARPTIVGLLTSVVFSLFSGFERLVTGPPKVPPNSTVTVASSTLEMTDGLSVPADWYYPAGDDPPSRMILLQHGFVTIGPMYSYTASNLAEATHSIVVAPTLTSNPFADGGFWLWGDGMAKAGAGLFTGRRTALTQSALAAGYAEQYGLDPETATLPRQFALVGHSAGGAAVSGMAGYLAENGAAADLVGVIMLDGVPFGDTLANALTRLDAYQRATGRYVPIRNIGAPWSIWNFLSNANESLSRSRPDRFNGVVLAGGVHTDSMQGPNPWIEFVLFVAAGFPQPQNPPAVREMSAAWLDDWFRGRTAVGDDLMPGSTIVISTPEGPATATVIGVPRAHKVTGSVLSAAMPLSA